MDDDDFAFTLSNAAQAANPGRLQCNLIRWTWFFPKWPAIWVSSLVGFVLLAWYVHWLFWIPAAIFLLINAFYWQNVREQFLYGCILPAVVVEEDPMLIAVATDMTKGVGNYPAIKIIAAKLPSVRGQPPRRGAKLAAIAVDLVTGDLDEIERVMETLDSESWWQLRTWLRKVPRPFTPGLYLIEGE